MRAADRGGPFGHGYHGDAMSCAPTPRNWMRASAPGIAFRYPLAESSPVGGAPVAPRSHRRRLAWLAAASLGLGLWLTGSGLYLYTKSGLAQALQQRDRDETSTADAPPPASAAIGRLFVPAQRAEVAIHRPSARHRVAAVATTGDAATATASAPDDWLRALAPGDDLALEGAGGERLHYRVDASFAAAGGDARLRRHGARPTLLLVAAAVPAGTSAADPAYRVVTASGGRAA